MLDAATLESGNYFDPDIFVARESDLAPRRSRPGCTGRLHLTAHQRAASAVFSVVLGRIAADVLF